MGHHPKTHWGVGPDGATTIIGAETVEVRTVAKYGAVMCWCGRFFTSSADREEQVYRRHAKRCKWAKKAKRRVNLSGKDSICQNLDTQASKS